MIAVDWWPIRASQTVYLNWRNFNIRLSDGNAIIYLEPGVGNKKIVMLALKYKMK